MASFISTNETLERRQNGVVSRTGGKIINRVLEESAGVDAGRFVCPSGTAGIACEDIDSAADAAKALGPLVFRPMAYDADLTDGAPHYAENEVACILEEGYMFVDCEGTVVAEQPVYVRHTSDGSSNTELGKVRGDSDGTLVIDTTAAAVEGLYGFTLNNGVVDEMFTYESDGSALASEIIAALVTAVNTSANYNAAGTTEITVTLVAGTEITVKSFIAPTEAAKALWTTTFNQKAARVPNAYFAESRTGAGLVEIRVGAPNR